MKVVKSDQTSKQIYCQHIGGERSKLCYLTGKSCVGLLFNDCYKPTSSFDPSVMKRCPMYQLDVITDSGRKASELIRKALDAETKEKEFELREEQKAEAILKRMYSEVK